MLGNASLRYHRRDGKEWIRKTLDHTAGDAGIPNTISPEKRILLQETLDKLRTVKGIAAVVLGGSYATGAQRPDSDLDLGLYYQEQAQFAIDDIREIAQSLVQSLAQNGHATVTGFYEWGAWVNGGAWIHTGAGKVDFLYRSVEHVQRVIQDARNGKIELDYAQQPPYGFHSVIYLAETQVCLPLYDPRNIIADLKRQVTPYPPKLKQTIAWELLWAGEFTLLHARDFAERGDVYNTVGCLTRALSYLTQVVFALNETYFISDKKAMATIETFPVRPPDYAATVRHILGRPGYSAHELSETVRALETLFRAVAGLTGGSYQPKYVI